jgi:hypothetical protein
MKHLFIITLLICLVGCTNSNPQGRVALEGDVTLNGQPLTQGNISFEPSGTQSERTQSGGLIKNGKYRIAAADGLVEGEYTVSIHAMEEIPETRKGNSTNPMDNQVEYRNIIPPEFGEKTTQKITVEKGKQNKFDFKM